MRFEFHDLAELQTFIEWTGHVHLRHVGAFIATAPASLRDQHAQHAPDLPTPGVVDGVVDIAEGDPSLNAEGVPPAPGAAPAEQKRKRRTKAENEVEKAAEQQAKSVDKQPETTPAGTTAKVAPENTGNPFAQQSLPAEGKDPEGTVVEQPKAAAPADATPEQAKQFEINEFVAARLAERPTLEQREHLVLARTFIGKHGMPKYNESFQLVGLSPNVMLYTEADCARHAAALDFLGLE